MNLPFEIHEATGQYKRFPQKLLKKLNGSDKKIIIFWNTDQVLHHDFRDQLKGINVDFLLFRTSLSKSLKLDYERVLPYLNSTIFDFKPINPSETDKPSIGFCGVAKKTLITHHRLRREYMEEMEESKEIITDFIYRHKYCGSKERKKTKWKTEFTQNLNNNIFNFCYRGRGNFSKRFYEVLSAGRIPVLIDSDTELPFENEIDWQNKIIFAKTPDEAIKKMVYLYNNKDIIKMQIDCQRLHRKYFTERGFIENIHKMI